MDGTRLSRFSPSPLHPTHRDRDLDGLHVEALGLDVDARRVDENHLRRDVDALGKDARAGGRELEQVGGKVEAGQAGAGAKVAKEEGGEEGRGWLERERGKIK